MRSGLQTQSEGDGHQRPMVHDRRMPALKCGLNRSDWDVTILPGRITAVVPHQNDFGQLRCVKAVRFHSVIKVLSSHASACMRCTTGVLMLVAPCGCGVDLLGPPIATDVVDGNRNDTLSSSLGKTSGEPNGTFSEAIVAVFDDDGKAQLQGNVSHVGDLDVFLLGSLSPGDRVIVDADTPGSRLDISVGIFDAQQLLVYHNDDRGGSSVRLLDSFIDFVVRHAGDGHYLVVTHAAFAAPGEFVGGYRIDVSVAGGFEVPEPVGQVLVLDFDGAVVDSPTLGLMTLAPFDAASISGIYRNQTDSIKETIRAVFEQNFERFNVAIWTTDDPPPDGTPFSAVYFGGFNADAFGIAENVDLYNADFCDDAVIFTDSFVPHIFTSAPTAVEMGIAIGNVGAHEAGHLLGLNHVDDDSALMDDQSVADAFLEDQEFMVAPLSGDIMRIGRQDAPLLLDEVVGPWPNGSAQLAEDALRGGACRAEDG